MMLFFLIVAGIAVLSLAAREIITRASEKYSDRSPGCRVYYESVDDSVKPAAADARLALYDGIVIDADSGFEHRCFYVRTWNGHVAVFNWLGSLCCETEVVVRGVDAAMRSLIEKGIYFNSFDDAQRFIEAL